MNSKIYIASPEFMDKFRHCKEIIDKPKKARIHYVKNNYGEKFGCVGDESGIKKLFHEDGNPDPDVWKSLKGGGLVYRRKDKKTNEHRELWKAKPFRDVDWIGVWSDVLGISRIQAQFLGIKIQKIACENSASSEYFVRFETSMFVPDEKEMKSIMTMVKPVKLSYYACECERNEQDYELV